MFSLNPHSLETKLTARVVVLEDMDARVEWLTNVLEASDVEVIWCTSVKDLITATKDGPSLIILDHDLGGLTGKDKEGFNGTDAVWMLEVDRSVPIVVWSVNTVSAPKMIDVLRNRGYEAAWVPFLSEKLESFRNALRKQFPVR